MTSRKIILFVLFAGFDRDRCAASKPIGRSREKTSGIRRLLGFSVDESYGPKSRFASKEPFHDAGLQIDAINQVRPRVQQPSVECLANLHPGRICFNLFQTSIILNTTLTQTQGLCKECQNISKCTFADQWSTQNWVRSKNIAEKHPNSLKNEEKWILLKAGWIDLEMCIFGFVTFFIYWHWPLIPLGLRQ